MPPRAVRLRGPKSDPSGVAAESGSPARAEVRPTGRCRRERFACARRSPTHRPMPTRAVRLRGPKSDPSGVAAESGSPARTEVRPIGRCRRERFACAARSPTHRALPPRAVRLRDRGPTHRPMPTRAVRSREPRSDPSPDAYESGPLTRAEVRPIARCLRERSAHASRSPPHHPMPTRAVRSREPRSDPSPDAPESGPPRPNRPLRRSSPRRRDQSLARGRGWAKPRPDQRTTLNAKDGVCSLP